MNKQEFNEIVTEFCGEEKILMCDELELPYDTFQSYLYGRRKIPDHVAQKALDAIFKVREFMETIPERVDQHQPHGVPNLVRKGDW